MNLISEADVERSLDFPSLIERLRTAFQTPCTAPLRHRHEIGDAILLAKPAWRAGGPIAVKIINIFPHNAEHGLPSVLGAVLLFDGSTGATLAAIDGRSLTVRRTAAASALAADYLARSDASRLVIIGTGQLAPALAHAHATVRPIRDVGVWGRSPEKAADLARRLADQGMTAWPVQDLEDAVQRADIVSCATLAKQPLVMGRWLKPGVHLDLVGSFTPDMCEADEDAVRRARLYVDTREGALAEAGELIQAVANRVIKPDDVVGELSELCGGTVAGRGADGEITLFKSVGTAIEDLAAAELAHERSQGHPQELGKSGV